MSYIELAERLYDTNHGMLSAYSYQPIVDHFSNADDRVQVDEDDYQGDTFVAWLDASGFSLLIFGWGSCSGCDALQACDSYAEVAALIESLENDIRRFESGAALLAYLDSDECKGNYQSYHDAWPGFVAQVKDWVAAKAGE